MLKNRQIGNMPAHLSAILNSYSEIFFIQGAFPGLVLLCISFLNYNTALCGLISVVVAYAFAHFIGFKQAYLKSGSYTYNPLLVGLAIGHLFQLSELTIVFIALSSILTFLLTAMMVHLFQYYLVLPVLSIPFVIVSSAVYLAAARFPNLFVTGLYVGPQYNDLVFSSSYINDFFIAVGSIVFMPNVLSGVMVCCLVLLKSRILLMMAVVGFITGTFVSGLFVGSMSQASGDISSFNYILIAVALGCVFNLPSLKSYSIAMIGVAISTILINAVNVFWSQYKIPVFTLPFTIITLSFVYVLRLIESPLRPYLYKATPEETLDYHLCNKDRLPVSQLTINLPFTGSWTVWQGFDGQWTHQGIWRYAYDFVIMDAEQKTYKNDGSRLDDYYCYMQPVLSPVRGRVVQVVNHFSDNYIGSVDTVNNWGNLVVIEDERGVFVELSHFAQQSIAVLEGSWVEPGAYLGLCGNSGYSPQPHIHVQVQATALMGSATMPFSFTQYTENGQCFYHGRPEEGRLITNIPAVPYYDQLSTFILDEKLVYVVYKDGEIVDDIAITIKMAIDGTFYFSRGEAKLYFGKLKGTFFIYHMEGYDKYLRMIYLSLGSFPLHYQAQLRWQDTLSNVSTMKPAASALVTLFNAFSPKPILTNATYQFAGENVIKGKITNSAFNIHMESEVTLDAYLKFKTIRLDNVELRRRAYE